jgi:hemolysin activation/secretion protein
MISNIQSFRFAIFVSALMSVQAYAGPPQTPTTAGQILRETEQVLPAPTQKPKAIKAPEAPAPVAPAQDIRVQVSQFTFSGNTAITSSQLENAIAEWSGKALNFGELQQVIETIETFYHNKGYFLAQATLPPQQIKNGVINIVITEGKIGKIRLEGESRIAPEHLYDYMDKLPKDQPMSEEELERQALLISDLIGGRVNVDLQAGEDAGTTDIVLSQKADPLFNGRADVDNHGLPATGEYRLGLVGNINSPFKRGDLLSANLITTDTGNLNAYGVRYDTPIGVNGWHVNLSKTLAHYNLGDDFRNLDARGKADAWRLGASYPLVRSRNKNIWLRFEADRTKLNNKIGIANLDLDSRIRGFTFNPSADWRDDIQGGGSNYVDLQLRKGHLTLDDQGKTLDAPPTGLNTEGSFTKAIIGLQRMQSLAYNVALQMQWRHQFTNENLDAAEKMTVGGPVNMVAYPNSQANFDQGGMGKLHLYWSPLNNVRLGTFAEYANVNLSKDPLPGTRNNREYSDAGFSVDWQINPEIDLAATIAWAGDEPALESDNDRPRLWMRLGYAFGESRTKIKRRNDIDTLDTAEPIANQQ